MFNRRYNRLLSCSICECGSGMPNSGFACAPLMQRAYKFAYTNLIADDGTKNRVLLSATLNQAFFDALINNADKSKRLYPSPSLTNPDAKREAPKYFTSDTGAKFFIQDSVRTATALIEESGGSASPQIVGFFEGLRCMSDLGVYIISTANQLIGKKSADGLALEPFSIEAGSISALWMNLNGDNTQHIELSFDFSLSERDSQIRMIDCGELGGADLTLLRGVMDIHAIVTVPTTDGYTIELITDFGTLKNPGHDKGLVKNDFVSSKTGLEGTIYDSTQDDDLTIDTITEISDGVYEVVLTDNPDPGDELIPMAYKTGRDYSDLVNSAFEIPTS